jgi:hypothetical protein
MQIDFHHGATYVVARLAGFEHSDAATIAYASQYVDDSTVKGTIQFSNGATYSRIASAHEILDLDNNCNIGDDYQVWLPFHFLPGNDGALAGQTTASLAQRLVCTEDSPIADDMWTACRARRGDANGLHRLGITSHVYADTFSHQKFAGFIHDLNLVYELEHISPADSNIVDDIQGLAADALRLGHGGALTDPDLPYLTWSYKNSFKAVIPRPNPDIFMRAVNRLFSQYIYFLQKAPQLRITPHDLTILDQAIRTNASPDPAVRHQGWLTLAKNGAFSFGELTDEEMAELNYVPTGLGSWKFAALGATDPTNLLGQRIPYSLAFENSEWKKFHDALKDHQNGILNDILPHYNLPSSYEAAKAAL